MTNAGNTSHSGLAEAAARLNNTMGGKREIERLPKHLFDGERVDEMAVGAASGNIGVLVLTDRRILFVFDGWVSGKTKDFPLDQVKGVGQEHKGTFKGSEIEVFASTSGRKRKELEIQAVEHDDAKRFIAAARAALDSVAGPRKSSGAGRTRSNTQSSADPMAQLERLGKLRDSGVLTEAEFTTQKQKILDQT